MHCDIGTYIRTYVLTYVRTYVLTYVRMYAIHTYFGEYLLPDSLLLLHSLSTQPLYLAVVLGFEVVPLVEAVIEGGEHRVQYTRYDPWVIGCTVDGVCLTRVGHTVAEHKTVLTIQEILQ